MEEEKNKISGKEAFLVCDDTFKDPDAPFFNWLESEGFSLGFRKGNYGMPWLFINITHKLYAYGMPGVQIADPVGNHAITLDEFMTIYSIYKKYKGKSLFVFRSQRLDYNE